MDDKVKKNRHCGALIDGDTPLVSIGVPTNGRSGMLMSVLRKLESQTYSNIQVLVADNHSPCKQFNAVSSAFSGDSRFSFNRHSRDIGAAATNELIRLELPTNPGAYVASACGDDGSGKVAVSIRNDTQVTLEGVQATVRYIDNNGQQRQTTQSFSGQVAPGKVRSVVTGIVPLANSQCAAEVINARIVE